MADEFPIPASLAKTCSERPEWGAWLERVPVTLRELRTRWSLTFGEPFKTGICSWVAPAVTADGAAAVFKLGLPHMEAEHEIPGLRFWNGDPTARLIDADDLPLCAERPLKRGLEDSHLSLAPHELGEAA